MYNFNDGTFWDLLIRDIPQDISSIISFGIYVESLPSVLMVKNNVRGVKITDDRNPLSNILE